MANYTSTANRADDFVNKMGTGNIDVSTDAFSILLLTSAAAPSNANEFISELTANEVSGSGYARQALTTVSWEVSGGANGQMRLNADDPVFSATGGDIVARYYVCFDNTPATDSAKQIVSWGLIDDNDLDVTTTDGNTLTLSVNANGIVLVG